MPRWPVKNTAQSVLPMESANIPQSSPSANLGAPAVLSIASEWERRARESIDAINKQLAEANAAQLDPANDGEDFAARIKILTQQRDAALSSWKTMADMVYKFDKSVDPAKRTAEESITRADGAKLFTLFAIYGRTAVERFMENIVPRVREAATNEDAYIIVRATYAEEMNNSMKSAINESHLPEWVGKTVESAL